VSPTEDRLVIIKEVPKRLMVYYEPSRDKVRVYSSRSRGAQLTFAYPNKLRRKLLVIDGKRDQLCIFPIKTFPERDDFLQPKYRRIESITLAGFGFPTPRTVEDVRNMLVDLPAGFVKNYQYGLGLLKDYRFIIDAIEEIDGIESLVISVEKPSEIQAKFYTLNFEDFDSIRRGINRITSAVQSSGRKDKAILAHNALLTSIDPDRYPEIARPYKKDAVFRIISRNAAEDRSWSERDKSAAASLVASNAASIAKHQPDVLMQLRSEIELVTLAELIGKFETMLGSNAGEPQWQRLFRNNPFILGLVFGFPVVIIQDQASVGGRTFAGGGDKITDFLVKNSVTHNSGLIEIKAPSMRLLSKEYRQAVFAPSPDLAGAVTQVLDQKYRFQKEIASLKDNSGITDVESYSVNCVLIAGVTPPQRDQVKSFELFRDNSRQVLVVTFDELLEKLRHLYKFLSLDRQD
jgi:copper chaperone CopZ